MYYGHFMLKSVIIYFTNVKPNACIVPDQKKRITQTPKTSPPNSTKPVGGHLQGITQRVSPPESSPLCHYARDRHGLCVGLGPPEWVDVVLSRVLELGI